MKLLKRLHMGILAAVIMALLVFVTAFADETEPGSKAGEAATQMSSEAETASGENNVASEPDTEESTVDPETTTESDEPESTTESEPESTTEPEPLNGWDEEHTCYYVNDEKVTGLYEIEGVVYGFNAEGKLVKNSWLTIEDESYGLDEEGKLYTENTLKEYTNSKGGKYYRGYNQDGKMVKGSWLTVGSDAYGFDENGSILKNKVQEYKNSKGGVYYRGYDKTGKMVKNNWLTVGGSKYYFNANGSMLTGKRKVGDYTYYFDKTTGAAYVSGVFKLDGAYYGFDSKGHMLTGWQAIGGSKYYFNKSTFVGYANCVKKIGSYQYGFNEKGQLVRGWFTLDGAKYYFVPKNAHGYVNVVRKINGVKYAFDKDGKLQSGWATIGGKRRYIDPKTGKVATGIVKIDGKTYWMDSNGTQVLSSGIHNGKYIIVKSNGEVLTGKGWTKYNGYKYYFEKDGYSIRMNTESLIGSAKMVLKVNKSRSTINVLAYDSSTGTYCKVVKAFVCSCGPITPCRRVYLGERYRWRELIGPCWGQWCTRFSDTMLFHSLPYLSYNDNNSMDVAEWNRLGTCCSHGCVRVRVGDVKWIYDHKGRIAYADIYESSDAGPFGKMTAVKLPSWHTWDPTDPNMKYKCHAKGCH